MNKQQQIELLQEQLSKVQEQLDEMKQAQKEEAAKQDECVATFPAMLADEGMYFIEPFNFRVDITSHCSASIWKDQNIFPDAETAEGYAEAFKVMLELRRCEGAGHYYTTSLGEVCAYSLGYDYKVESLYLKSFSIMYAFFPPFPTEGLAQAALDKIGCSRIRSAIRFLANVKD